MIERQLRNKKIIHVTAGPRMFTQFRMPMILNQKKYDHTVVLYCPRRGKESNYLLEQGFQMHNGSVTNRLGVHTLGEIGRLFIFLKKNDFDIMFAHQPMGAVVGITAGCLAGVPIRIYSTGGLKWVPGLKAVRNQLMKLGERLIIRMTSAVFLVNREDEAVLKGSSVHKKAYYVGPRGGCGINPKIFSIKRRLHFREKARRKLQIKKDTTVIGYTGRLVWEKGFREIIQAASILKRSMNLNKCLFIVLGTGPDTEEIKQTISDGKLADQFLLTGYVRHIEFYMSVFDIFLLPSYREGLPVALLEAMALGIPSIASDIRGNRDLIQNKTTGLLVPANDAQRLSEAIHMLIEDVAMRSSLGSAGAEYVYNEYDETHLLAKTSAIIGSLVSNIY